MSERLVEKYLGELKGELHDLPPSRRRELLAEISDHIDVALAQTPDHDEAEIRNVLERLGDPADIAQEARQRFGVPPARSGAFEVAAVILLPIGGVVIPVLGWVAGVILLWTSRVWTTREKLAGTLLFPGGLLLPILLLTGVVGVTECFSSGVDGRMVSNTCGPGPSALHQVVAIGLLALLVVVPIAMAVFLGRRAQQRSSAG
jgi:uncharacterized membrane protein